MSSNRLRSSHAVTTSSTSPLQRSREPSPSRSEMGSSSASSDYIPSSKIFIDLDEEEPAEGHAVSTRRTTRGSAGNLPWCPRPVHGTLQPLSRGNKRQQSGCGSAFPEKRTAFGQCSWVRQGLQATFMVQSPTDPFSRRSPESVCWPRPRSSIWRS